MRIQSKRDHPPRYPERWNNKRQYLTGQDTLVSLTMSNGMIPGQLKQACMDRSLHLKMLLFATTNLERKETSASERKPNMFLKTASREKFHWAVNINTSIHL